jgi:hypothetical protein
MSLPRRQRKHQQEPQSRSSFSRNRKLTNPSKAWRWHLSSSPALDHHASVSLIWLLWTTSHHAHQPHPVAHPRFSPPTIDTTARTSERRRFNMVSGRRRALATHNSGLDSYDNAHRDVETGFDAIKPSRHRKRFRDAIEQTIHENRAVEMKKKLIDNVDHDALERYRKSEESVCVLFVGSRGTADNYSAESH